jgi:hypothetical protein
MILLIQDRKNNLHLVDYTPPSGNKFTICGIVYRKKEILNTLALDNTVHNICRTCYEDYETMYGDDLKHDPRLAHSSLHNKLLISYIEVVGEIATPEIQYQDLGTRRWEKLG